MLRKLLWVTAGAALGLIALVAAGHPARADASADIKALEDRFVAAIKAGDLDAIMKVYVPN